MQTDEIWGAITALNHLVEASFEVLLSHASAPSAAVQKVRERVLREFDMPPRPQDRDEHAWIVQQHALSRIETFFDALDERLSRG